MANLSKRLNKAVRLPFVPQGRYDRFHHLSLTIFSQSDERSIWLKYTQKIKIHDSHIYLLFVYILTYLFIQTYLTQV